MYVFTSAVFFLTFFSLYSVKESDIKLDNANPDVNESAKELKEELLKEAKTKKDSVSIEKAADLLVVAGSIKNDSNEHGKVIKTKKGASNLSMDFGKAS